MTSAREQSRDPVLTELESRLTELWELGRNLIVAWCLHRDAIEVLVLAHYHLGAANRVSADRRSQANSFFHTLITGSKRLTVRQFRRTARTLEARTVLIPLPGLPRRGTRDRLASIEALIQRYGVSYRSSGAVALFDIVGFSKLSAFEQLTQINSLAYSCNSAYSKFAQHTSRFDFARSTAGDGFYVWNRDAGVNANIDLYQYVHLILADNAIARQRSGRRRDGAPQLKTAFHIGSYYEFFQSEGLQPSAFNYIVGDVTIELARMIEKAVPGQILIGDFQMSEGVGPSERELDTLKFIEEVQPRSSRLQGLKLSGQEIEDIRCYLTGRPTLDGQFTVRGFRIIDKHGYERVVYNAKINIHRRHGTPVFLGLLDAALRPFEHQPGVAVASIALPHAEEHVPRRRLSVV